MGGASVSVIGQTTFARANRTGVKTMRLTRSTFLKASSRALAAAVLWAAIDGQPACGEVPQANALDAGFESMYNLQFAAAHQIFARYQQSHPDDPMGPVSDAAAYLFCEFNRLNILRSDFIADNKNFLGGSKIAPDPKLVTDFQAELAEAQQLAEARLKKNPADQDALLGRVLAMALDAHYKALIQKRYRQALTEIKQSQGESLELLKICADCYDGYLATGFENYLLSQKPGPERWLLRRTGAQTNKQIGIHELKIVADKGHYLKPYAKVLLAIVALRDNKKQEARSYLAELSEEFPQNDLFRQELEKLS
jgi:hypothetical protein